MAVDMKAKNKGKPKSLPGTPAGKNKGNFQQQKKSLSPNSKPGGGGGFRDQKKGSPGGGKPFFKNNKPTPKKFGEDGGKPQPHKQENAQSPSPNKKKFEQNGNAKKEFLKKLDSKSKPNFKKEKPKGKGNADVSVNKQAKNMERKNKKSKSTNRYHRFQQQLNKKVRTPQACARALKAEQELSTSQGRVLKITLPDPSVSVEQVNGWSNMVESVLFSKPLPPRTFTIVLKAGINIKKEIEKLSKVTVGNGKITVQEHDPAAMGHTGGQQRDPVELIDPYTLYVTNLPENVNKTELEEFFKGAVASSPRKHNPKLGNVSKYAFMTFETPEAALTALKENFNKELKGKSIVMRFRRLNFNDLRKEEVIKKEKEVTQEKSAAANDNAVAKSKVSQKEKVVKAAQEVKVKETPKKAQALKALKQALKQEPDEDDDDDDSEDDDDDEMDVDMEQDDDDDDDDDDEMDAGMDNDDDDDEDDDEDDDDDDDDDDDEEDDDDDE